MASELIIDDAVTARVQEVLDHAEKHPYRRGMPVPGDNPAFVAQLGDYRCVFTYTHAIGDTVWRHLSISVRTKDRYPHPLAAYTIAELFGFTGWDGVTQDMPDGWLIDLDKRAQAVILIQPVTPGVKH